VEGTDEKTDAFRQKHVAVLLCSPHITDGKAWSRTRSSWWNAVDSRPGAHQGACSATEKPCCIL